MKASTGRKIGNFLKDTFGGDLKKFQAKSSTIMDLKAKILQSSKAVFEGRMLGDMGDVKKSLDTTLDRIKDFSADAAILAEGQSRILETLDEYKDFLKPKTRWEWAKATYESNVAHLDPYHGDADMVLTLLRKRQQGTCTWVFEEDVYQTWLNAESSQMLYLTGQGGTGKSIIAAAIFDKLRHTIDQKASTVYVSFTTKDNTVVDLGDDRIEKVKSTLLFHTYSLLAVELDNGQSESLLEDANKLFQQLKKADQTRSGATSGSEFYLPPFRQTMTSLLKLIKRDLVMVVDGLDQLEKQDQDDINEELETLVKIGDIKIRIMTVCQREASLGDSSMASTLTISVEDNIQNDIVKVLDDTLAAQQGLTAQERKEAKDTVLQKAGSHFAYVSDIAVPFLKQPFRRPYRDHLETLPEGVIDTYRQALAFLQPAYYDLLQTALLWTLYAQQPIRVQEIMEAHSGIYLVDLDMGSDDDYEVYKAQKNDVAQLNEASSTFLRIYNNSLAEPIAVLKDLAHIRQLCSSSDETASHAEHNHICQRCRSRNAVQGQLTLRQDKVHIRLAIRLLKHLNSPLFQKRYYLSPEPENEENVAEGSKAEDDTQEKVEDTETSEAQNIPDEPPKDDPDATGSDEAASTERHDGELLVTTDGDAEKLEGMICKVLVGTAPNDECIDEQGYLTAASEDGEDEEDDVDDWDAKNQQLMREDKAYSWRYEIEQWPYHVQEAEKQWSNGDIHSDPEWLELIAELDKFAFNTPVFHRWLNIYRRHDNVWGSNPLNVAAHLGLQRWAEHLITDKDQDPTVLSDGYRPLEAVQPHEENKVILKYLLEQTQMRINPDTDEQDFRAAALDRWLQEDGSPQTIQFFLDAGADFAANYVTSLGSWTPLHSLARSIKDPESLKLVLNAPGQPDIKAKTTPDKSTPLHILLMDSDISTSLVDAFLDSGASIDEENAHSMRPLDTACWTANLEIVETLLRRPIKDINDPDLNGLTALHSAAEKGDIAILEALIAHDADIERKTRRWRTTLSVAVMSGQAKVTEVLISKGANLITPDGHGRTPMFWACYENKMPELADIVLAALKKQEYTIQQINITTKEGRTVLRIAATRGFVHIVEDLINMSIAAGIDVQAMLDIQDTRTKSTALHRAASHGQVECVRLLLKHGACATLLNSDEQTALQVASVKWQMTGENRYEEIMRLCLPSDLTRVRTDSELAILAATHGSVSLLQLLVEHNVDVHKADPYGWTPLLHVQRSQMTEAETFLKSYAAWRNKLPQAWTKHKAVPETLELSEDALSLSHTTGEVVCLTTDRPLPGNLDRFYFEITLKPNVDEKDWPKNPEVAIGFGNFSAEAFEFPGRGSNKGWRNAKSWAYHGDDGWYGNTTKFLASQSAGQRVEYICGEPFGPNDVIGAGVDLQTQQIWFTKNGVKNEFQHDGVSGRLFPLIGCRDGVMLETKFKPPFKWAQGSKLDTVAGAENAVEAGAA